VRCAPHSSRPPASNCGNGTANCTSGCRGALTWARADPARWSDGWLHTRDAARVDGPGGRVTILGRRDSQVSIGGLKVDLTEVEQALGAVPGVTGAVVVFEDAAILAYAALDPGVGVEAVRARLARELAAYKLPRRIEVLAALPRTATGKLLRDNAALRAAAAAVPTA
jgi:acyl-coenzyme A synthetase/AMP-(fatty) acid ligase